MEALIAQAPKGMVQDELRAMLSDLTATQALMSQSMGAGSPAIKELQQLQTLQSQQHKERNQSTEVRHYLCDHLGTPNALINQRGEIEWAAQLDAWGQVVKEFNPNKLYQPIRLPGQHQDQDTGLYYNRYRYYDAEVGSYVNQDPINLKGGNNLYGYPLRPLRSFDALGLQAISKENQFPAPTIPMLRSDGFPIGAGCGDASTDKYVSDSYFGKVSFLPASTAHDKCYETLRADKNACDNKFGADMLRACNEADARGDIGAPALCRFQKRFYVFVLKDLNMRQSAFDVAQEKAFWEMIEDKMKINEM